MGEPTPPGAVGPWKRTLDVCVAGGLLVACAPAMATIGLLVRMSSPGAVLFRQTRVGQHGRLFAILKFRTMRADQSGPSITSKGDTRITPVGRWMRKLKLDELPQLVNVLRGDMSLVGPRPEVAEYVRLYTEEQLEVLAVRPGITGLSQLEFVDEEELLARSDDPEELYVREVMPAKLRLDLHYVRGCSPWLDIRIMAKTVLRLLSSR